MKKWITLFVIGIVFFSTIAFAIVQSLSVSSQTVYGGSGAANIELPRQSIIDYRMSPVQYNSALDSGFTVATYKYDPNCVGCIEERQMIEQIVLSKEFQNQIILEEVSQTGDSGFEVKSLFGERKNIDTDSDSVTDVFCELVLSPPLGCVGR